MLILLEENQDHKHLKVLSYLLKVPLRSKNNTLLAISSNTLLSKTHIYTLQQLILEFHLKNLEAPQHISVIDFTNLPFCPISNFTDTPVTVLSDWATGHSTLGSPHIQGGG